MNGKKAKKLRKIVKAYAATTDKMQQGRVLNEDVSKRKFVSVVDPTVVAEVSPDGQYTEGGTRQVQVAQGTLTNARNTVRGLYQRLKA